LRVRVVVVKIVGAVDGDDCHPAHPHHVGAEAKFPLAVHSTVHGRAACACMTRKEYVFKQATRPKRPLHCAARSSTLALTTVVRLEPTQARVLSHGHTTHAVPVPGGKSPMFTRPNQTHHHHQTRSSPRNLFHILQPIHPTRVASASHRSTISRHQPDGALRSGRVRAIPKKGDCPLYWTSGHHLDWGRGDGVSSAKHYLGVASI
jgi:hypothetical protein